MRIGFVGDTHGQAYHLLGVVLAWPEQDEAALDVVIQLGDFGAQQLDYMLRDIDVFLRWPANDPAQFDFLRICRAGSELSQRLDDVRRQLHRPVLFLRGDHDDAEWLRAMQRSTSAGTIPVDPFDLFHYLPDGTVFEWDSIRFAIFGGVETPEPGTESSKHDAAALDALLKIGPEKVDVLLTHEPPHGVGRDFHGQVQGSAQVSTLIEVLRPRYHLAAHLHTMVGPTTYGATTYLGLQGLGSTRLRSRHRDLTVHPGTVAILDTGTRSLGFVTGSGLARLDESVESIVEPLAMCRY
jgi:predicted phosphodiesterase